VAAGCTWTGVLLSMHGDTQAAVLLGIVMWLLNARIDKCIFSADGGRQCERLLRVYADSQCKASFQMHAEGC